MKNSITFFSFFALLGGYFMLLGNSAGSIVSMTGGPGDQSCGITSCHNTMSNQGNAIVSIDFNDGQSSFELATTNIVKVKIDGSLVENRNGFQIVALDENNNSIGTFATPTSDVQLRPAANGREYVTHTFGGSSQTEWSFEWTSPDLTDSPVNFYVAALDANNNGNKNGDDLYTTSLTIDAPIILSNETESIEAFTVFPNPVINELRINNIDQQKQIKHISLSNSSGQIILINKDQRVIDMSFLDQGLYFLSIEDMDGNLSSKKLIKL